VNRARDHRIASLLATLALVAMLGYAVNQFAQPGGPATGRLVQPADIVPENSAPAPEEELAMRFREAVFMLHARNYDYAVTALHRVLELAPRLPEAHVNMGFALLGLERYAAARDFFQGAIELRPQQVNAYWGLATSREALCDLAGATGAMRSYVHLTGADDPFLPKARAALWEWEAQAGRAAGAGEAGCPPGSVLP
jgi:Flp pilus assembly protein TadD